MLVRKGRTVNGVFCVGSGVLDKHGDEYCEGDYLYFPNREVIGVVRCDVGFYGIETRWFPKDVPPGDAVYCDYLSFESERFDWDDLEIAGNLHDKDIPEQLMFYNLRYKEMQAENPSEEKKKLTGIRGFTKEEKRAFAQEEALKVSDEIYFSLAKIIEELLTYQTFKSMENLSGIAAVELKLLHGNKEEVSFRVSFEKLIYYAYSLGYDLKVELSRFR